jgi:cell division protease FtsH
VVDDTESGGDLGRFLFLLLSVVLGVVVVLYVSRGSRQSSDRYAAFVKSTVRLWERGRQTGIRFADVAGVDEAVQELEEVVEFLRYPEKFSGIRRDGLK